MDYRYCPYCGTPLVTKTDKEPPRLYCPHCEKFLYRNPMAAVAGIVLNDTGAILLVQRAAGETYPGNGVFPAAILSGVKISARHWFGKWRRKRVLPLRPSAFMK